MIQHADVVVVGGGIIGASIAYHLASKRGGRICLLERERLNAGSTGASGGFVRIYHPDTCLSVLAQASLADFREWPDRVGGSCEFVPTGFLYLFGPDDVSRVKALCERGLAAGVAMRMIAPADVAELEPEMHTADLGGAIWETEGGFVNPATATRTWAAQGRAAGLWLMEGVEVTGFVRQGDRITGLQTSAGLLHTEQVVLCASSWVPHLLHETGYTVPVRTKQIVIHFLRNQEGPMPLRHMVLDDVRNIYFRPDPPWSVLVGLPIDSWPAHPDGVSRAIAPELTAAAHAELTKRIPAIGTAHFESGRSRFDAYTPDELPIIGPLVGLEGLYLATGFNGGGVKFAPYVGKAVASEVLTGEQDPLLAPFRLNRPALRP